MIRKTFICFLSCILFSPLALAESHSILHFPGVHPTLPPQQAKAQEIQAKVTKMRNEALAQIAKANPEKWVFPGCPGNGSSYEVNLAEQNQAHGERLLVSYGETPASPFGGIKGLIDAQVLPGQESNPKVWNGEAPFLDRAYFDSLPNAKIRVESDGKAKSILIVDGPKNGSGYGLHGKQTLYSATYIDNSGSLYAYQVFVSDKGERLFYPNLICDGQNHWSASGTPIGVESPIPPPQVPIQNFMMEAIRWPPTKPVLTEAEIKRNGEAYAKNAEAYNRYLQDYKSSKEYLTRAGILKTLSYVSFP